MCRSGLATENLGKSWNTEARHDVDDVDVVDVDVDVVHVDIDVDVVDVAVDVVDVEDVDVDVDVLFCR